MSSLRLKNPNSLLRRFNELYGELEHSPSALEKLSVDWLRGELKSEDEAIMRFVHEAGMQRGDSQNKQTICLTGTGLSLMSKLLINFDQLEGKTVAGRYHFRKQIAEGTESVAFDGMHSVLGSRLCLKVLRPGRIESAREALSKLGQLSNSETLVLPIDVLDVELVDENGMQCLTSCIVYPFIDLPTFESFIKVERPLSPYFVREFIRKLATGLHELEERGLCHGDLHEQNILCGRKLDNSVDIKIIDVTGTPFTSSQFVDVQTDYESFREHISALLEILPVTQMSLAKHVGASTFELLKVILSPVDFRFADVLRLIDTDDAYKAYQRRQKAFLSEKFSRPTDSDLALLRYEEIVDPRQARSLFLPFAELFNELATFGNAILYGHRGSGKSSYLASLAYFPDTTPQLRHPSDSFGIFFACRQGEFKHFTAALVQFSRETELVIKHVLILKIIRKTVGILRDAADKNELVGSDKARQLSNFLNSYVPTGVTLGVKASHVTELQNLHAALLRNEIEEIDYFFGRHATPRERRMLTERDLIDFFERVRSCFEELASTQFYILFDDAGAPNVPLETQRVLNELLRCTNAVFCVKVSAERFSYTKDSADGKALESPHDYKEYDISDRLRLGTPSEDKRRSIEAHFKELVEKRLQNYQSRSIDSYLGRVPVKPSDFVRALVESPRKPPEYAGWEIIWQLADRTPRHLLELVSEIFSAAGVNRLSEPVAIPVKRQSEAVIAYSIRKLRSLGFIPGALPGEMNRGSIGARLQSCVAAFGKVSRGYLKRGPMTTVAKRLRFYEVLAIEVDDEVALGESAKLVLNNLIRYAVFDDTKLGTSRDDRLQKPFYILNRVYCPALRISFRREMHWRLSNLRFSSFLDAPESYVERAMKAPDETSVEPDLFDSTGGLK